MAIYDANNPRHVAIKAKMGREADRQRQMVIGNLMSSYEGRQWAHDQLVAAHVFSSSFTGDNNQTNFNEGERNSGLKLLADINAFCPHQYVVMMREVNERAATFDARLERSDADADGGNRRSVPVAVGDTAWNADGPAQPRYDEPDGDGDGVDLAD